MTHKTKCCKVWWFLVNLEPAGLRLTLVYRFITCDTKR